MVVELKYHFLEEAEESYVGEELTHLYVEGKKEILRSIEEYLRSLPKEGGLSFSELPQRSPEEFIGETIDLEDLSYGAQYQIAECIRAAYKGYCEAKSWVLHYGISSYSERAYELLLLGRVKKVDVTCESQFLGSFVFSYGKKVYKALSGIDMEALNIWGEVILETSNKTLIQGYGFISYFYEFLAEEMKCASSLVLREMATFCEILKEYRKLLESPRESEFQRALQWSFCNKYEEISREKIEEIKRIAKEFSKKSLKEITKSLGYTLGIKKLAESDMICQMDWDNKEIWMSESLSVDWGLWARAIACGFLLTQDLSIRTVGVWVNKEVMKEQSAAYQEANIWACYYLCPDKVYKRKKKLTIWDKMSGKSGINHWEKKEVIRSLGFFPEAWELREYLWEREYGL